jgi:hypothetical protein
VGAAESLRLALERAQRERQALEDDNCRLRQEAAATAAQLERLRQLHSAAADGPPRARGPPAAAAAAPRPRGRASGGSNAVELATLAASLLPRGHRAAEALDALLSAVQGDAAKGRLMQRQQAQLLQLVGGQPARGL